MKWVIQILFGIGFILAEIAIWTMHDSFSVKCASSAFHFIASAVAVHAVQTVSNDLRGL